MGHSLVRHILCFVLGIAALSLSPTQLRAEPTPQTLKLGYCLVDGFIESEDKGVGVALMNAVSAGLAKRGFKVEPNFVPCLRLQAAFQARKLDLVYPLISDGAAETGGYKKWGFERVPLYSSPLYVGGEFLTYTRVESPKIHETQELKGLLTGIISGAFAPPEIKAPSPTSSYEVVEIRTVEQAFEMLRRGRIDAFVIEENRATPYLGGQLPDGLHHGRRYGGIFGAFAAQPTNSGAGYIAEINQVIGRMILDGSYARILATAPENKSVLRYPAK